jgi:glycine/D-amino acid oxidase-like deaminating enzyme
VHARATISVGAILPATVRIERRGAVRTHDAQVLESIVVGHTIGVIENQRHFATAPSFVLAAQLARPDLQALLEQAILEVRPRVGRALDQDPAQSDRLTSKRLCASTVRIKMIDGYLPDLLDILAQRSMVATRWAHSKPPQRIRVTSRGGDCRPGFLLRVSRSSTCHERMFA